jgi:hypothetical protein
MILIELLDDEAREIKKQYKEKIKALETLQGKGRESQETSSDGYENMEEKEDKKMREKTEALRKKKGRYRERGWH